MYLPLGVMGGEGAVSIASVRCTLFGKAVHSFVVDDSSMAPHPVQAYGGVGLDLQVECAERANARGHVGQRPAPLQRA